MIGLLTELYSVSDLYSGKLLDVPNEKGIYIILKPENMKINLLPITTAISVYRGKDMLYDLEIINTKYNKTDKSILYIGKAGGENNKLKDRIKQLVRYGYGEARNHRGGRAVWQIEYNKDLQVGYFVCDEPEYKEKELLTKYIKKNYVLPFANWQI